MNFRIGQKVVCVGRWLYFPEIVHYPEFSKIYTVRGKRLCPWNRQTPVGLLLEEIVNPVVTCLDGTDEPAWDATAFRPLVTKKTDISVFKRMLAPALGTRFVVRA